MFRLTKIITSNIPHSPSQPTYTVTLKKKEKNRAFYYFKAECDLYLQAMYNDFSTANIQIDKDFSAKLSGYGCVGQVPTPESEISNNSVVSS